MPSTAPKQGPASPKGRRARGRARHAARPPRAMAWSGPQRRAVLIAILVSILATALLLFAGV